MTGRATGLSPLSDSEVAALGEGGLVVRDDVVDPARVVAWRHTLADWSTSGRMTEAGVGRAHRVQRWIRGDLTAWVEPTDLPEAHDLFGSVRELLAHGTWVALDGFELQAACYPGAGARYARHVDALREDALRRFTAILYLNPDWVPGHGGQLIAWTPTGLRRIAPRAGRMVLFRSECLPHAVSASRAPRYALTAWMRGP